MRMVSWNVNSMEMLAFLINACAQCSVGEPGTGQTD